LSLIRRKEETKKKGKKKTRRVLATKNDESERPTDGVEPLHVADYVPIREKDA